MLNPAAELQEVHEAAVKERLEAWRAAAEAVINKGNAHDFMNVVVVLEEGRRYYKVLRHHSKGHGGRDVYAFIDKNNGDIFRPADSRGPAKHRRGNLFDDKAGLGWVGKYGIGYLR
jgi:hypothetical protein